MLDHTYVLGSELSTFNSALADITSSVVAGLGKHTKVRGSFIMAGVGGGALYAPLQGVYMDVANVQHSYWVSWVGFMMSFFYSVGMVIWKHKQRMVDAKQTCNKAETKGESGSHLFKVDQKEEKPQGDTTFMGAN